MSFSISGLPIDEFLPLFDLSDDALNARGIIRKTADASPGYPCRISLEDARPGETVLLLNYESHRAETPYRSAYAVYVRDNAKQAAHFINKIPPIMQNRPIALRIFDQDGMLIGADMAISSDLESKIEIAFENPQAAYIHAHNAMHGCFAAEIRRGP